jgi:hypothetical protein
VGIATEQKDTAIQQKELVQLQTRIAEAQALPRFVVAVQQIMNPETKHADDNVLVVENNGGEVHEFEAKSAYFLRVEVGSVAKRFHGTVDFAINGYFTARAVSRSGTGQLVTVIGPKNNNATVGDIMRGASQYAKERHWDYANVDEFVFARLQYRDVLDREHEAYYSAHGVGGGTRLDEVEGKKIFERWDKFQDRLDFSNLTAEKLVSLAYDKVKDQKW